MSLESNYNAELYHYGVKGMKWGQRKKRAFNTVSNIAKDLIDPSRTMKTDGPPKTRIPKDAKTDGPPKTRIPKDAKVDGPYSTTNKGVKKAAKVLGKIGNAYLTDQIFFGGAGTRAAKAAVNTIGRATITAYTMARGGYDIKWYDKQGRRVG